eukprot:TRINITY_DN9728_c0_g1_i1.p1 TRINITY_DN9728_c0_g1~~TRINITY_DN9728_c0_g1_i1.p1  ORF type:complete len:167 (+),score=21.54 TRINITY_DN9728_c0_g1_i1:2-502(+)
MEEEDLLKNINATINSADILSSMQSWEEVRSIMRSEVLKFWNDANSKQKFKSLWTDPNQEEVKTALLLTSQEEVLNGEFGFFVAATCPELNDVNEFISKPDSLFGLFDTVCSGKENMSHQMVEVQELNSMLDQPERGIKLLKLARSFVLVQFVTYIIMVANQSEFL